MNNEPFKVKEGEFRVQAEPYDVQKEAARKRRNRVYLVALCLLFLNGLILLGQNGVAWKLLAVFDLIVPVATGVFHWLITHKIVER